MGGFVRFDCLHCGYTEERIGFGHGKQADLSLQLYCCDNCKTVGSNWVKKEQELLCSGCYSKDIEILESGDASVTCPKCNTLAVIKVLEETWD